MENSTLTVSQAMKLTDWYEKNKRSLPWRDTGNPYDVWLSEIMLQQTRIEAVKPKFIEFRRELPDIASLAECDDDRLMRLWEGMGYYSRAKNLKKCAVKLMEEYDGSFPHHKEELEKLPGIGPYTAGAIASICFEQPVPAVDGNVLRVVSRLLGLRDDIRLPAAKNNAEKNLVPLLEHPDISASSLNQGLMELGEVVCVPNGAPHCEACPLHDSCIACREKLTSEIPYRSPLKKRSVEKRTLLVIRDGERFLMNKRPDTGLLASLYEFYGVEGHLSRADALKETEKLGLVPLKIHSLPDSKHIFTHKEWHMKAFEIMVEDASTFERDSMFLVTKKELAGMAVPSAFKTYTDWFALRG